jgi:chromatin remodeling complex protein RSC6
MSTQPEITTPTETSVPNDSSTVQQMLSALVEMASQQAQQTREMHRNLKKLAVEVEREQKKLARNNKPKRTVKQKPVKVSAPMHKFLSKQSCEMGDESCYTRQVMMKAVSAYIKLKGLQLEENRKSWKADKELIKLFGLDVKETYTFMNINGLLSRVVEKKPE